jgi:hypothetical protein
MTPPYIMPDFRCPKCSYTALSKGMLRSHLRTKHDASPAKARSLSNSARSTAKGGRRTRRGTRRGTRRR